ncbi:MAG: AMP-binding protein [Opitutales bacterium]
MTLAPLWQDLARRPEEPALILFGEDEIERITREELAHRSREFASGLRRAGLEQGDRVAVFAANRAEWIVAALGILRAGLVLVPIDAQSHGKQLAHILEDSAPSLLLVDRKTARRVRDLELDEEPPSYRLDSSNSAASWEELHGDAEGEDPPCAEDDVAVLFYTSGTTGSPKGVPLTQRNLAFQFEVLRSARLVRRQDRMLVPLPLHHVYPFVIGMLAPLALRVPTIHPHAITGPQLLRAVREGEATLLLGVPRLLRELGEGVFRRAQERGRLAGGAIRMLFRVSAFLHRNLGWQAGKWLLAPLHREVGPRLRLLVSGGSLLPAEVGQRLEALGWQVAIGYGLTETSPLLTINKPGRGRLETLGCPVDGIELRCNPEARPEGADAQSFRRGEGEIQVRGPGVFAGYHHLEEKSAESFTEDGFYRTGDLGWIDDDGEVHYAGRLSTLIVTEGGENIRPEDVEEAYAEEPEIAEFAVLLRDDKLVGLAVPDFNYIETESVKAEEPEVVVQRAVDRCASRLASYQQVTDLAVTSESLPRTRLGKPRRHQLEDLFKTAKEGGEEEGEARPMAIEEMEPEDQDLLEDPAAAAAWDFFTERYGSRPLSPESRLVGDLGIDSLAWMNLTLELQERTGARLDEETIERLETMRDLLREISSHEGEEAASFDLYAEPEQALTKEQRAWLRPLTKGERCQRTAGDWLNRVLLRAFLRVQAHGLEHLPEKGPYVLAPSHESYLDAPVLASVLPRALLWRARWAGGARAIQRNRLVAHVSRLAGAVPVRGGPAALAFGVITLREKRPLIWYPEGGISPDGSLLELQRGLGMLLEHEPVTVVPVRMRGTHRALPEGSWALRPRRVGLVFGEAVEPSQLADEGEGADAADRITEGLRRRLEALGS